MDKEYIQGKIDEIKKEMDDPEVAHGMEDDLYAEFIEHISKREDSLGEMAKLVLTTEGLDFSRWFA